MADNGDDDPQVPDISQAPPAPWRDPGPMAPMAPTGIPETAFRDGPNAYGPVEALPGITSGPAPKPWGLNRDQPTYNQLPAYGPGGRSQGFPGTLQRIRPIDERADPRMREVRQLGSGPIKMPGGGISRNYTPARPPSLPGLGDDDTAGQFGTQRWKDPTGEQGT